MARGGQQHIPRPEHWRVGGAPPWHGATPRSVDEIVNAVASRPARPLAPPFVGARNSAVLVLLQQAGSGPEILLTKRSMALRHHRGEISFPGGRMDAGESAVDTALREAHEEVALVAGGVTVHGELDHLSTVVSESYIVPVVGSVAVRPPLTPHDAEVDRILWVPVAELTDPDVYREERWGTPPFDRPIHFFELDDETIWGATARMLHQLLTLAYGPPATRTAE